jgi:diguanylate cyclase
LISTRQDGRHGDILFPGEEDSAVRSKQPIPIERPRPQDGRDDAGERHSYSSGRSGMKPYVKRTLQIAVILAIAILGALCATQTNQTPTIELYVLALIALGIVGVGLGEIREADSPTIASPRRGSLKQADATAQHFDSALGVIVKLIQAHLEENSRYSDSLERANKDLPSLDRPEQVRAVVSLLIDENEKIQTKMNELSKNLEASRAQVAKLRSNLAEANELGLRDPLTSLGNRRFFDANLAKEVKLAQGEGADLCLVMADLDHFKKINDRFGHPVGDMVLKLFGELLSSNIKGKDTAARYGGEEFAIIFPSTKLDDAAHITDQIRHQLEGKQWMLSASGQRIGTITASFGVARLRRGEDPEALVKRVDAKLYEAKISGRNRVVVDSAA